ITVTGSVTDSIGQALEGINVRANGPLRLETRTDQNGNFILEGSNLSSLVFTNVGYQSKEVEIPENHIVKVILQVLSNDVEEVVVTAFSQKQRKEALVGSVTSIEPEKLKIPASNLTGALAGQMAGVIGFQRSGQPGQDNSQFFIRGVTTFGYRQEPLILIDN